MQLDQSIAVSPLGSGALAGSAFNLDVLKTAKLLNFNDAAANSLDAVSDRDFVAEFLFNLAMISVHLSKLAEEIILLTTSEFGYAKLHDSWSTGSSLMPQKKNPDIAELTRGKTGRFIGNLTSLLITLKALPFAYNRDLQEDKEPLFDSIDQMNLILPAMSGLIKTLVFDSEKLTQAALANHAAATDIADYLVKKGVAFSKAHEIVGSLVLKAESLNLDVSELPLSEFQAASAAFQSDLLNELNLLRILNARSSSLGTAPISVKQQLKTIASSVQEINNWANSSLVVKL
jgi:argininosuccinate lyase